MRKTLMIPGVLSALAMANVIAHEAEAEGGATKSIIDPKYQGKYKEKDWLGKFIDEQATDPVMKEVKLKDEDGKPTGETEMQPTAKTKLDLDKFFALADANYIDTASMKEQRDRPNAPGRIRMTLGNSLRAAAKHRHGLFDLDGNWVEAPEEFLGDAEKTQNPDGSKIAKEKPAEAEAANAAE